MEEKLLQFQNYLIRNRRTLSTAKVYTFQVKKLLIACPVITQEAVDKYLTACVEKTAASYMNCVIYALKTYFKYIELDILLPKWGKVTHKKIKSLPMEYVENKILPAVDYLNFQNPYKVKAILYLMVYTGMRKSEVPLLMRSNFNLDAVDGRGNKYGEIKAHLKKTKKEHVFIFPKKVASVIKNYFTTESELTNAFNIGNQGVTCIFKKLKTYFQGNVNLFPHLFKKIAITHLHNKCRFSLKEISEMVGISVATIESHYLDIDMDKIKDTYCDRIK